MSIIIVGVGQAEFDGENTKVLQGNKCVKKTNKKKTVETSLWFVCIADGLFYSDFLRLARSHNNDFTSLESCQFTA